MESAEAYLEVSISFFEASLKYKLTWIFFFKLRFLLIVLQCFLLVQVPGAQSDTCLLESSPPPSSFQEGSCKWLGFKEKFVSRIKKKKENTLFKDVICTPLHQKRQTMKKLSAIFPPLWKAEASRMPLNGAIGPIWKALCWLTKPQICLKHNSLHIFKPLTIIIF